MKKNRGNHEGTYYQRPDGRWCGQIMIDNKRYSAYGKNITECKEKLRLKVMQKREHKQASSRFSVYAEYFLNWQVENKIIKMSTLNLKKCTVDTFCQLMSDPRLKDINLKLLNEYTGKLITMGIKRNTITNKVGCICSVLNHAVREGILENSINGRNINKGPQNVKRKPLPPIQIVKKAISNLQIEQFRFLCILLLNTGLRGAEGIAITWEDIDLDNYKIYVNRTYFKYKGNDYFDPPKSNRIGEYVQFPISFKETILEYKKNHGHKKFLISKDDGSFWTANHIRKAFSNEMEKLGYSGYGLHVLRHFHASTLMNAGVDLTTIQNQLRHASILTTDKYLHQLKEDVREEIMRITF